MNLRRFLAALACEFAGLTIGGTIGGLTGWKLNSYGVASDPENFWAICVLSGAALGLVVSVGLLAWSGRGDSGKVHSTLAGAGCWVALGSALLTWVIWSRRL